MPPGKPRLEGKVRAEADLSFTILEAQHASANPFIAQRDEYYLSLKVKETLLKAKVDELDGELIKLLYTLPNVPNEAVKQGREAADNNS